MELGCEALAALGANNGTKRMVSTIRRIKGRETYRIFKWTVLTCLFTKLELDWKPHSFPFASFQTHLDFPPPILWMCSSVLTVAGGLAVEDDCADSFLGESAGEEGEMGVCGGLPVE